MSSLLLRDSPSPPYPPFPSFSFRNKTNKQNPTKLKIKLNK